MIAAPMPTPRPGLAHGSQLLRDAFVCALALLVAGPLLYLWPRACAAALAGWVLLFFTPLPRWLLGRGAAAPPAGPVAVLAGGFAPSGALSARSERRVRFAVTLARERGAELILCGGARVGDDSEAQAMARRARALGFEGPLRLEDRSRTTFENLLALAALTSSPPPGSAPLLVVTCPQHRARVARLAGALGAALCPIAYPAADLPRGPRGALGLALECFYELAIHAWLTLRRALCALRLLPPLGALRRAHLSSDG